MPDAKRHHRRPGDEHGRYEHAHLPRFPARPPLPRHRTFDRLETVDRGRHGRQEHRRVEVFEVEGRLDRDWRPWIACAARVTRLTWRKDTRTGLWARGEEVALYACQARLDAATFGRAHRGIENRDHH